MSRDDPTAHQYPAYRLALASPMPRHARRGCEEKARQGRAGEQESRRGAMTKANKTRKFAQVKCMLALEAIKQ
jgi:hypothetical protein